MIRNLKLQTLTLVKNFYNFFTTNMKLVKDYLLFGLLFINIFNSLYSLLFNKSTNEVLLLKSELMRINARLDQLSLSIEDSQKDVSLSVNGAVEGPAVPWYEYLINNNYFMYSCYIVGGALIVYCGYLYLTSGNSGGGAGSAPSPSSGRDDFSSSGDVGLSRNSSSESLVDQLSPSSSTSSRSLDYYVFQTSTSSRDVIFDSKGGRWTIPSWVPRNDPNIVDYWAHRWGTGGHEY